MQQTHRGPGLAERCSDAHVFQVSPIFMTPPPLQLSSGSRPDGDAESSAGGSRLSRSAACCSPAHRAPPIALRLLRAWKNPLPVTTGNCRALGRLSPRNQRTWFAARGCFASSQPSLLCVLRMNKDFPGLSVLCISPAFASF